MNVRTIRPWELFEQFYYYLMNSAPADYIPWFFPVTPAGKNPAGLYISTLTNDNKDKFSWKASHAKLTLKQCLTLLENGYNIGLAARADDNLVIIDIDDYNKLDLMPDTLIVRSRSRTGLHGFFWAGSKEVKCNIPTDFGEMRAVDQYVLAVGSYVPLTDADIVKKVESNEYTAKKAKEVMDDYYRGYYTIEKKMFPKTIQWADIPWFFKKQQEKDAEKVIQKKSLPVQTRKSQESDNKSALHKLQITDLVSTCPGRREAHPLHPSDTGQNFSVGQGLAHCWRHNVSLNAFQYLVVQSGYMSCQDAGTPHSGQGVSGVHGDDGAVFYAWIEAKKSGLIPINDPVPLRAMAYIGKKNGLLKKDHTGYIKLRTYNYILRIIERCY
jgi:putative DNA primase/helicase